MSQYHEYLASREWALKREEVRRRSGNTCERCHAAPQQAVHHLSYEHLYDEPLEDLQAICNNCHAFLSAKSDFDPIATITTTSVEQREADRHLTVSIRQEAVCECCSFETYGNHFLCKMCKRISCAACTFTVGDELRCVDHAEAP